MHSVYQGYWASSFFIFCSVDSFTYFLSRGFPPTFSHTSYVSRCPIPYYLDNVLNNFGIKSSKRFSILERRSRQIIHSRGTY